MLSPSSASFPMRKHATAESISEAPTEKKRRTVHKKEAKETEPSPELGAADRFMAEAKKYMSLKERAAKLTKEIDTVRGEGLALSAVQANMLKTDIPNLEEDMQSIAAKYGRMADRFADDAERVHVAEQAAKKIDDKKEKSIMRAQISDIAAAFVRQETMPEEPVAKHAPARKSRATKPKQEPSGEGLHPDNATWIDAGKTELAAMTEEDIRNAVDTLDDSVFTGTASSPETRQAAEKETTKSALADIRGEIENISAAPEKVAVQPSAIEEDLEPTERMPEDIRSQLARAEQEANLDAIERRIKGKFGADAKAIIATEQKGFWSRVSQKAKLFLDPELGDAMKEYRAVRKALQERE